MQIKRIAILFSGNGSNLEALIVALHNKYFIKAESYVKNADSAADFLISTNLSEFKEITQKEARGVQNTFKVEVVLALSNKADAYGLQRAEKLGVETKILLSKGKERECFDKELVGILKEQNLDLCVLAGFMRILTPIFTQNIKAINIHPSLLPLFKGAHGLVDSYNSSMCFGGVSVHFVSDELDSGEIIAQGILCKNPKEKLESYEKRVHKLEHILYPKAVLSVLASKSF
ncbi:MAG: phosphoribosylglycinamide formyltransferase [Helicobacteraceae bacterium]|nr:phosphoribosylglycinamide formyltransferase [Helicobacteraceae bacterium]